MKNVNLNNLSKNLKFFGTYDRSCTFEFSSRAKMALSKDLLKINIVQMGNCLSITNAKISIASVSGTITIFVGSDSPKVFIGDNTSGVFHFRLWRSSTIIIKEKTTSNGLSVVCDKSEVIIGSDCLFSDGILLQSADQHGIVDIPTGRITNNRIRKINIGDHVWVGRKSTLLPDVSVGKGAVIGAGSIVSKNIPDTCIAAGVPAKVIKKNKTWSRFPDALDSNSIQFIEEYKNKNNLDGTFN